MNWKMNIDKKKKKKKKLIKKKKKKKHIKEMWKILNICIKIRRKYTKGFNDTKITKNNTYIM